MERVLNIPGPSTYLPGVGVETKVPSSIPALPRSLGFGGCLPCRRQQLAPNCCASVNRERWMRARLL